MNLIVKANASKQQKQQKNLNDKRKIKEKCNFNLEKNKRKQVLLQYQMWWHTHRIPAPKAESYIIIKLR